ncbi:hypothetical protein KIH77_02030 [Bifidobacterium sp. 82T24]|uniref:hypothetical protein n=1 Tax=Bifidobacterium pluvialisilvae TaxID=2834436 RepID=UPI001C595B15|nr:hypothetical protein [Bifidobacterium pluvialisilvae]MBW3087522.1 hypothetical protein [Bifidobacterium pluvialisilvae]
MTGKEAMNGRNGGPRLRRRRRRSAIVSVVASMLAIVLAVPAGYALGGMDAFGMAGAGGERCLSDARNDIEGMPDTVSASADVSFHGSELTDADAGAYYQQAVDRSWRQIDEALLAVMGGDLPSMRAAAASAESAIDETITALQSHTWPSGATNAVKDVVRHYMELRADMAYVASSASEDAGRELTDDDMYSTSDVDTYLRDKLGIGAAKPHTMPVDILAADDAGIHDAEADDIDGMGSTTNDGKRIVNVTVRSNTPGTVTDLGLDFDLRDASGKTVAEVQGSVDHMALTKGRTVVVAVPIAAEQAKSGRELRLTGMSVRSGHDTGRIIAIGDDIAKTVAALDDFRLR